MYARQNPDEMQTFRRGNTEIPANYAGNAFTADEEIRTESPAPPIDLPDQVPPPVFHAENNAPDVHKAIRRAEAPRGGGGLLDDLLTRFTRGLELDDLILIGLLLLLWRGREDCCENSDELILLLALLLFMG